VCGCESGRPFAAPASWIVPSVAIVLFGGTGMAIAVARGVVIEEVLAAVADTCR